MGTPDDINVGVSVPQPDIEWEPEQYTMKDILTKFSLPRVVKCGDGQLPIGGTRFDFTKPMLLYDHRDMLKFAADNVNYQETSKKYEKVGERLLIPKDNKGWFALIGEPGSTKKVTIPLHTTVESLVKHRVLTFLIGGNHRIRCFQINKHFSTEPDSRTLFPGDVLRICGVHVAKTQYKKKKILKSKVQTKEVKLVLCTDEKDRQLYLSLETKGYFYTLSSSDNTDSFTPIVQLDMVKESQLPVLAKLVYGNIPTTPCCFTGTMILSAVFKEESVISSTLVNARNIMLEVPVNTNLLYSVAKHNRNLLESQCYKKALSMCYERTNIYKNQIKVSFVIFDNEDDNSSVYSGPENPPPPLPRRKQSLQSNSASSTNDILNQSVPIRSAPSIRLCFGSNSIQLPVNKDGTIKKRSSTVNTKTAAYDYTLDYIESLNSNYVNFSHALLEKGVSESNKTGQATERNTLPGTFSRPSVQSQHSEDTLIYENMTLMKSANATPISSPRTQSQLSEETLVYENMTLMKSGSETSTSSTQPNSMVEYVNVNTDFPEYEAISEVPLTFSNKVPEEIAPAIPSRRRSYNSSVKNIDPEDDLPLGASSETFMREVQGRSAENKTELNASSKRASVSGAIASPDSLNRMSVEQLALAFTGMGMSKSTIQKLKCEEIDGSFLQSVPVESIDDYFPELNAIEKRKMMMFINGHRKSIG